ncbi:MAG: restriction endonuclease subunit S [Hormoscilla sp. GUM202]|nr:restriction endonuclease subunit S [Hormoscilla sp. GM7CHS1pb]MBO1346013.1 restriction endonuclease subunit S [Hormoscilla sp. GUM202]
MTSTKTIIPGYSNLQLLHSSQRTIVYRGLRGDEKQPVVIKLLRSEYPTFNELVNFRNQYVIAKNLDLPGVVKPLALENYGNGFVLVMDDFGGVSLSDYKVYGISKNNLKNILLPVPGKKEQRAIASILSDMDAEIAALEKRRAKTQAMKQGMMQELLTGKTRLAVSVVEPLIDPNNT